MILWSDSSLEYSFHNSGPIIRLIHYCSQCPVEFYAYLRCLINISLMKKIGKTIWELPRSQDNVLKWWASEDFHLKKWRLRREGLGDLTIFRVFKPILQVSCSWETFPGIFKHSKALSAVYFHRGTLAYHYHHLIILLLWSFSCLFVLIPWKQVSGFAHFCVLQAWPRAWHVICTE